MTLRNDIPPARDVSPSATASLPTPRQPRYLSLDLWRGVACLMVIVTHSLMYVIDLPDRPPTGSGPWRLVEEALARFGVGVTIFFVISGYCVCAAADAARRRPAPLGTYFTRRLRRIYPPFWTVLLTTSVVVAIVEGWIAPGLFMDAEHQIRAPWALTGTQWLANVTLTESWRGHVVGPVGATYVMGHAWSLCYEEQFYAVLGLLLWLAPRRFFRAMIDVTLTTVAVLGFFAITHRHPSALAGFFFDGHWLLFAVGLLVYYLRNYGSRAALVESTVALASAAVLILVVPAVRPSGPTSWFDFFAAAAFGVVLLLMQRWDEIIAHARALQPLAWCGTRCYSLYLVHWPITKVVSHVAYDLGVRSVGLTLAIVTPSSALLSLVAAGIFHRVVERRFLNAPLKPVAPERESALDVAIVAVV